MSKRAWNISVSFVSFSLILGRNTQGVGVSTSDHCSQTGVSVRFTVAKSQYIGNIKISFRIFSVDKGGDM